jgi:hypothetical protein
MKEIASQISTRNPADGRTIYTVHTALDPRPRRACYSLRRGLIIDEGHGDLALMIPTRNDTFDGESCQGLLRWGFFLHS